MKQIAKKRKKEKNASYNEKICMHDIAMCTGWPTMTTLCGHCYYNRRWCQYDQTDQKNSSIIFHFQQEKKWILWYYILSRFFYLKLEYQFLCFKWLFCCCCCCDHDQEIKNKTIVFMFLSLDFIGSISTTTGRQHFLSETIRKKSVHINWIWYYHIIENEKYSHLLSLLMNQLIDVFFSSSSLLWLDFECRFFFILLLLTPGKLANYKHFFFVFVFNAILY